MLQHPGPQSLPAGMESPPMAVAGDFHPMHPAQQQQQGDFTEQHPVPPPPPMEMESESSMGAVAGDFPAMHHPVHQQQGSFRNQHPGPLPFPPAFPAPFVEEEMAEPPPYQLPSPPPLMDFPSFAGIESNEDDELEEFEPPREFNQLHHRHVNELIRDEDSCELEKLAAKPRGLVNLMGDPLLSVVISCRKTQIALKLIGLPHFDLAVDNYNGDTALHVAASVGDRKVNHAINSSTGHTCTDQFIYMFAFF